MLKSWRSLLRCELATCVCFVRAYTRVCVYVCVYVRVCVRVRVHAFNLLTSVSQTWRLASSEHAPIVIASLI